MVNGPLSVQKTNPQKKPACAASTLTVFRRIWFSMQGSADFAARFVLG